MKHISIYLLLLLVLGTSCTERHYYMNTKIQTDGTCSRELWFKANSATLTGSPTDHVKEVQELFSDDRWIKTIGYINEPALCSYPMPEALYDSLQAQIDHTATTRYRLCDTLRVHAKRDFSSVGEMAEAMPFTLAGQPIRTTATLESHFRWFYTDYTYTETFPSISSLFKIPLTHFMDEQMASFWLTGTPNPMRHKSGMAQADYFDKMSSDFLKWLFTNLANDYIDILIENYDSIANPPISKADLLNHKQEFIDRVSQSNFKDGNLLEDEEIEKLTREVFHHDIFSLISKHPYLNSLSQQRSKMYEDLCLFNLDYRLEMPGEIIQINECSENLEFRDGALLVSISGLSLVAPHLTIQAVSTSKNTWAFVLTWIFGFLLIALCLWPLVPRRKEKE